MKRRTRAIVFPFLVCFDVYVFDECVADFFRSFWLPNYLHIIIWVNNNFAFITFMRFTLKTNSTIVSFRFARVIWRECIWYTRGMSYGIQFWHYELNFRHTLFSTFSPHSLPVGSDFRFCIVFVPKTNTYNKKRAHNDSVVYSNKNNFEFIICILVIRSQ